MRCTFIVVLALLCPNARAESFGDYIARYAPSLNGGAWPRFPVVAYVEAKTNTWVHPSAPKRFPTLEVRCDDDSDFSTVILHLPNGRSFKTYSARVLGPYFSEVYSGDFNNDGLPDFVAVTPGGGCGLAGEYCVGVFAFSERDGYRFTRINAIGLGPGDLVCDPTTKAFRLIHTPFCSGKCRDDRYHSFWVHRFFEWSGVGFQVDPKLPAVWIQYLDRPNHEPTKLLTPALKAKLWENEQEFQETIEW